MLNIRIMLQQLCALIFLVLVVVCLAGCATSNTGILPNSVTNTSVSPDYNRWLRKQPCTAPCWEGITPGITTYKQAQLLLDQNNFFTNVELKLPTEITWDWRGTRRYSGSARFDAWSAKPVIHSISIGSPESFKIKDVIAAFGYPSHVSVAAEPGIDIGDGIVYSMYAYYVPYGFYLFLGGTGDAIFIKPAVSPETLVGNVNFFVPSMDGLHNANVRENPILWQGTFDFDTYCKLQYGSEANSHCQ